MDTTDTGALDQADMGRLAAGEDEALDDLMDRHAAAVHQFLGRFLGDPEEARDLAQETFVRVYRHRERFRHGERFTTWLYTIAGNLARNQLRWRSRHPSVPLDATPAGAGLTVAEREPSPSPGPAQAAEAQERIAAVRKAVDHLPVDLKEAVVLCEWEEWSVAEAAAILRTTPKAVESRLYRARKHLREALTRWFEAS